MAKRRIKRIAFLMNYRNRDAQLIDIIPEVAGKGYQAVALKVGMGDEQIFAELAKESERFSLEVMAFTAYMKYQTKHLIRHPEQRMLLNAGKVAIDQDRLPVDQGCPFNPAFLQRHLDFLEGIAKVPNLSEVWLNDEAALGFRSDRMGCYCDVCRKAWKDEFGGEIPQPPFKNQQEKVQVMHWRVRRWNEVHGQMKQALNKHHPVRAAFQSSPNCCLLGKNPWVTGVDLSSMIESIDGIMTDPYYTFHLAGGAGPFVPREIYMSEHCRFLRGLADQGKLAELCAQGFSHPTFTRPLDERDGWWAGVIPAALGMDAVAPYTYLLQKTTPMLKTYEESFRLDEHFAGTHPLDFVAVVNSLETQCFHIDGGTASEGDAFWLHSRLMPVGAMIRHHCLPYTYLPSCRLDAKTLARWPVIALPNVTCLNAQSRNHLRDYVKSGGLLIAFGDTATRDEIGQPLRDSFLGEIFGIQNMTVQDTELRFEPLGDQSAFAHLPWPDEITSRYFDGTSCPVLSLRYAVQLEPDKETQILATFSDQPQPSPATGHPAITVKSLGEGYGVYVAGIPHHEGIREEFTGFPVLNFAGRVISSIIMQLAGDKLPLRMRPAPPVVPMQQVRPLDRRNIPASEFMPCAGPDLYLATVASYFREPLSFQIEALLDNGKKCTEIRELVADEQITEFESKDNTISIDVQFSHDDCLKVYGFFLS